MDAEVTDADIASCFSPAFDMYEGLDSPCDDKLIEEGEDWIENQNVFGAADETDGSSDIGERIGILMERMSTWQHMAAAEEREDIEREAAVAAQRGKGQGTVPKAPPPPPAFVHRRPRSYPLPTGKGFKGKMKHKANMAAAACGAAPQQAFRFIEAVLDAAAAVEAEVTDAEVSN